MYVQPVASADLLADVKCWVKRHAYNSVARCVTFAACLCQTVSPPNSSRPCNTDNAAQSQTKAVNHLMCGCDTEPLQSSTLRWVRKHTPNISQRVLSSTPQHCRRASEYHSLSSFPCFNLQTTTCLLSADLYCSVAACCCSGGSRPQPACSPSADCGLSAIQAALDTDSADPCCRATMAPQGTAGSSSRRKQLASQQ